jgi:hypothetical protein
VKLPGRPDPAKAAPEEIRALYAMMVEQLIDQRVRPKDLVAIGAVSTLTLGDMLDDSRIWQRGWPRD